MFQVVRERFRQGQRTISYPKDVPPLPDRFRGLPVLDESKCPDGCRACIEACPTDALFRDEKGLGLDLGRCLFCTDCIEACPADAIRHTQDHRLATRAREQLIVRSGTPLEHAGPLEEKRLRLFRRSIKLRVVSAGGDNSGEADFNVLSTVVFDIGRFGMQVVASPRHADGLVVIGPVSQNMKLALQKTYDAIPAPRVVIAMGTDAISGGPFRDHPEVNNGCDGIVPVDLYIPGAPPHPLTILDGLLRLLDRLESSPAASSPEGRGPASHAR